MKLKARRFQTKTGDKASIMMVQSDNTLQQSLLELFLFKIFRTSENTYIKPTSRQAMYLPLSYHCWRQVLTAPNENCTREIHFCLHNLKPSPNETSGI